MALPAPATVETNKKYKAIRQSHDIVGLFGADDVLYHEGRLALYSLLLSAVAGAGAACTKLQ